MSNLALEYAARAWQTPETETLELQPELAKAFAAILDEVWSQPWLGNATTEQLLAEIRTRIELDGRLQYRTVDGGK